METEMESNTAIPVDQGSDLGSDGALDLPPPYQLHSTSELLDSSATVLGTLRCYVSGPGYGLFTDIQQTTAPSTSPSHPRTLPDFHACCARHPLGKLVPPNPAVQQEKPDHNVRP